MSRVISIFSGMAGSPAHEQRAGTARAEISSRVQTAPRRLSSERLGLPASRCSDPSRRRYGAGRPAPYPLHAGQRSRCQQRCDPTGDVATGEGRHDGADEEADDEQARHAAHAAFTSVAGSSATSGGVRRGRSRTGTSRQAARRRAPARRGCRIPRRSVAGSSGNQLCCTYPIGYQPRLDRQRRGARAAAGSDTTTSSDLAPRPLLLLSAVRGNSDGDDAMPRKLVG